MRSHFARLLSPLPTRLAMSKAYHDPRLGLEMATDGGEAARTAAVCGTLEAPVIITTFLLRRVPRLVVVSSVAK